MLRESMSCRELLISKSILCCMSVMVSNLKFVAFSYFILCSLPFNEDYRAIE